MPRFFIDRPVFAWVIALGVLLGGIIALRALPIEQYPQVAPPSLTISVAYPGADAQTLEQNVTQVIEQQLNGVEGYLYMASTSQSNGTASITLTFEAGTDIDIAQTEVQNRLSTVEARLPESVRRQGITVRQANSGFLLIVALTSQGAEFDAVDLGNIASTQVIDELRRVPGVGDVQLFGSQYAMRIWLNPEQLNNYSLMPSDVAAAIRVQNAQVSAGQIGAHLDPVIAQVIARADARQHQQLRRHQRAGGKNDPAGGADLMFRAVPVAIDDTLSATIPCHHPLYPGAKTHVQVRGAFKRRDIGVSGRAAPPGAVHELVKADTTLALAVEIGVEGNTGFLCGFDI